MFTMTYVFFAHTYKFWLNHRGHSGFRDTPRPNKIHGFLSPRIYRYINPRIVDQVEITTTPWAYRCIALS